MQTGNTLQSYRLHKLVARVVVSVLSKKEKALKLREITKQMTALLEQKSGCLVHAMEDPNLSTFSSIKNARSMKLR